MAKHTIAELNKLYQDSITADAELFAEQRSNLLLIAGDHYTKQGSKFWNRIRDSKDLSSEVKLRLTKNHLQRIVKNYVSNIISYSPSVACVPANENELQDQKAAELNQAVWLDTKKKYKISKRSREWAEDFVGIGEAAVKIFWNPFGGEFQGYSPKVDEFGQPTGEQDVKFSGQLVFERLFGFNIFRDNNAKSMDESKFIGHRKMVDVEELKKMVGDDEQKLKWITSGGDETFTVFDQSKGDYGSSKGQCLVKEYFFRPSYEYPNGYFYYVVTGGILWEGELPFGIFPIAYAGFEEIQTTPRARSIVKHLRPYQAEINRAASKIAEHQVTLGDDKIMVQNGTKISSGGQVPGVRAIQYSGMPPSFLPGRDGSQYLAYMQSQIAEMYEVAMMKEDALEKEGQLEPYTMLYRSLKQKKKFAIYAEKFEGFHRDVCEITLELLRKYLPDDAIVRAIGRPEAINIKEFKSSDKLCYLISIEPQAEDLESKMGKQLVMNHALQYVGNKLEKEDIGKLMRNMPFGNFDESFGDMTMDYDNAVNDLLALDRGEFPIVSKYDNHAYMAKRLVARMRKKDFDLLPPNVQANYNEKLTMHEQLLVKQQQEIQAAAAGFIPSGGFLVPCDFYVSDPLNPGKTRRVKLPSESIQWLVQHLEQQGSSLEQIENATTGMKADMAHQALGSGAHPTPGGGPMDQGAPPKQGQASPVGAASGLRQSAGNQLGSTVGAGNAGQLSQPTNVGSPAPAHFY